MDDKWLIIADRNGDYTDRLTVPGGWLYRNVLESGELPPTVTMVFVPKPERWSPNQ